MAASFCAAVVGGRGVPGEGILPGLYEAGIVMPLLAGAPAARGAAATDETRELVALHESEAARLKAQIENLRDLSGYFESMDWERPPVAVSARLAGVELSPYRRHFRIRHRPAEDANRIAAGMPVVVGRALLGIVLTSRDGRSVVRRIDDHRFKLDVEIVSEGRRIRGIAVGTGDGELAGELRIAYVREAGSVREGDAVFASAYDARIPPGLLVGWVVRVKDSNRDRVFEVHVKPAALERDFTHVEILRRR